MSNALYKPDSPSAYYMSCMSVEPTTIFNARYEDLNDEGLDLLYNVCTLVGNRQFKGTLKECTLVPMRTGSLIFDKSHPMYTKHFAGACDVWCASADRVLVGTNEDGISIKTSIVSFFSIEGEGDESDEEEGDEKWGWAYTMSGSLYKIHWANEDK